MAAPRLHPAVLVVLIVGLLLPPLHTAEATPAEPPPRSTDVPFVAVPGETTTYIVNTPRIGPTLIREATRAIGAAGGIVTQPWPQIGVLIASSTDADFLTRIRAVNTPAIASVGPAWDKFVDPIAARPRPTPPGPALPPPARPKAAIPPDPLEHRQWALRLIKADRAHTVTDGSPQVLVGIADAGIDPQHPDLRPNLDAANSVNCTTPSGAPDTTPLAWRSTGVPHGTHVAGIVAAARNGQGTVGVAPRVRIASIKMLSDSGQVRPHNAICGLVWSAERRMPIVNYSLYVGPFTYWCDDQPDQQPAKEALRRAAAYATRHGVTQVAGAGNMGDNLANKTIDMWPAERKVNQGCHQLPTEMPGVVIVSAVDASGIKATFSNYGQGRIHVTAPGRDILSTTPVDDPEAPFYGVMSGTSMAAPQVAGVLALLKSAYPATTSTLLVRRVLAEADDVPCPANYPSATIHPEPQRCSGPAANNSFAGEGLIDALDAVRRPAWPPPANQGASVSGTPPGTLFSVATPELPWQLLESSVLMESS